MFVDSALGISLEKVDIVLVGAETVVENGGIINKV
jgi:translation initiation factor 2B subunit (eIF-2B alpha/beta/delta family)